MASGLYRTHLESVNFLIFYFTITSDWHILSLWDISILVMMQYISFIFFWKQNINTENKRETMRVNSLCVHTKPNTSLLINVAIKANSVHAWCGCQSGSVHLRKHRGSIGVFPVYGSSLLIEFSLSSHTKIKLWHRMWASDWCVDHPWIAAVRFSHCPFPPPFFFYFVLFFQSPPYRVFISWESQVYFLKPTLEYWWRDFLKKEKHYWYSFIII